jgi:tetratricopeptide (TPR) repeat protein
LVVVEFRLLGPVELWAHGRQIQLPSIKVKQLLAALLWDPGEMVSSLAIIRRLWDEDAPPAEMKSLHSYVSRLRTCLAQCGDPSLKLEFMQLGYRLTTQPDCIDVFQLRRDVARAGATADRGELDEAIRLLRSAENLVRGEPLAGLPGSWARRNRGVLEEQIQAVTVRRIELQLSAHPNDARDLLPELHDLFGKNEYDETVLELRLRALHQANRAPEALDAYNIYRKKLRDRSGVSPGRSLQALYARLLQAEPTRAHTSGPSSSSVPPRLPPSAEPSNTLAPDLPGFVGRSKDVAAITREIDGLLGKGMSAVCVIDGMPAVGKSSLALHLSHHLRHRCPDGALQLHLRGHDESLRPTSTESALDVLLRMLGVDPGQIQHASGLEHSIALWRKHTSGKRLLVFLDDAADAEQVLPLIPNGPGSIVLVTARKRLSGLQYAIHHSLSPMIDGDAEDLFLSSARMSRTTDPALGDVVAACGGFPMALCLAGAALRFHSSWNIADLADDLAETGGVHQLDSIIAPSVYRSVATSYRDLPDVQRRLLRRLSLNPGSRIHLSAVAVLVEASPFETNAALYNLVEQNLVMEPTRRYYELHDMIRLFAAHACETDENPEDVEHALGRLTAHILGATSAAASLFHPHRHTFLGPLAGAADSEGSFGLSTARQASVWLDENQLWLRTIAMYWYETGNETAAAALSHLLAKYLDRKSLWKESIPLHERGLGVWRLGGDLAAEAHCLTELAASYWRIGSYDEALEAARSALTRWTELGDVGGEADALLQLGRVHHSRHRHADAIDCLRRSAALRERDQQPSAFASALQHLSTAQFDAGRFADGFATIRRALRIAQIAQDTTIACNCVNSLGNFYFRLGEYTEAQLHYRQALDLAERIGDTRRVSYYAQNLGECMILQDRPEAALPLLERAFEIYQRTDDIQGQAETLAARAHAELALGRHWHARALADSAAEIAERFGDPLSLSRVHTVYGHLLRATGDFEAAKQAYRTALHNARSADIPLMQAAAFHHLGDVYEITVGPARARRYWRRALDLYGDIASPEADVLAGKLGVLPPDRAAL